MTAWGGGYVTDVSYLSGFYSSQSQSLMALPALLNGFLVRPVKRDEPFRLLDIGCGVGVTALITAAANPGWHVTGLDFHPGHIAAGRAMAHDAGLDNITFIEADLREFAETPEGRALEEFHAVSAHGVWSWVADSVQDGILRLLNAKLKAGGVFQVSYNLLTGWQSAIGLQRLVREAGLRLGGRSDKQATAGLKVAEALVQAGGGTSYGDHFGKKVLERLTQAPAAYLAHELMNAQWRPLMHGDVAARLASAKLEYAGSGNLLSNFPQLTLSAGQREVLAQFDDPAMLELFKDICRPQPLRKDVFIRGGRRIDPIARDAMLQDITLGLVAEEKSWKFEFDVPEGKAQMAESYYRPIFQRLQRGPASVGELMVLPELEGKRDNPSEMIGIAVGTEQAFIVPNPGVAMDDRCSQLNSVLLRAQFAAGNGAGPINFAVPALGSGLTLPNFEGMIIHELATYPDSRDPREMAARLAIHQSAEARAELAARLEVFFTTDAPMMRNFGFKL
jgi:hypothetical protein